MTTKEEVEALKKQLKEAEEQEKLDSEYTTMRQKLEAKLELKRKNTLPDDMGGQMRYFLEQHGLRTAFYCFVFAMTIVLCGLLTPYALVKDFYKDFYFVILLFNYGPVLLILYGAYSIPYVKTFVKGFFEDRKEVNKRI